MVRFNKLLNTRIIAIIVAVCLLSILVYCPPAYSHAYSLRVPMDDGYERLNEINSKQTSEDLKRKLDIALENWDKKEAEIKAKMWTKDQLIYHLSIIETDPDSEKVLEAIEAIADVAEDVTSEIIDKIEVPNNVQNIIKHRINSEKEDAMQGRMINELNAWGFYVPAFRELMYKVLEDWAKQPDAVEQVLRPILHEDVLDKEELVRFLRLIYPILSQDANEGLIEQSTIVLNSLLDVEYGYEEIVSEYLVLHQGYLKRVAFLTGHKKLSISRNSHEILYEIGVHPKWDIELHPKVFQLADFIERQENPEAALTEREMFLLARQISTSPSPRELVSDFFEEGARLVFVTDNVSADAMQTSIRMLNEVLYLRSNIGLTHVAFTLPSSEMINFQRFLDGEDLYHVIEILNEGLGWFYSEDSWSEAEKVAEEFREVARRLRDAGVEFILFDANTDFKGELVIDAQVQNLEKVFKERPSARVLAYGNYYGKQLHNKGSAKLSSIVSRLVNILGGSDRVAVVLQDEDFKWRENSMDGLHNLEEFLEKYPVDSDFGLRLEKTVIYGIKFDYECPDTYGEVFDGVIFRTRGDEGGGGRRLLKPIPTPLGTKKRPVPVFTPIIDMSEDPRLQMTPAGGLFSLESSRYLRTSP